MTVLVSFGLVWFCPLIDRAVWILALLVYPRLTAVQHADLPIGFTLVSPPLEVQVSKLKQHYDETHSLIRSHRRFVCFNQSSSSPSSATLIRAIVVLEVLTVLLIAIFARSPARAAASLALPPVPLLDCQALLGRLLLLYT